MSVSFVRTANNGASSGSFTSQTLSFDATGCNMLVVFVSVGGISGIPSSITATYAGVSMTAVSGSPFATSGAAAIFAFYLASPTTGVNNVSVSWTGSATRAGAGALGFASAQGTVSSIQSSAGAPGSVTSTSAVTSTLTGMVVACLVGGNGTTDTFNTSGATNDWSQSTTGFNHAGCHIPGATSVTPASASSETVMVGFNVDGGSLTTKSLPVSCTSATTSTLGASRILAVASTTAVVRAMAVATGLSVACTGTIAAIKAAAFSLPVACSPSAVAVKSTSIALAAASATSTAVTAIKAHVLVLAVSCATSVSRAIAVSKIIAVSCVTTLPRALLSGVLTPIRRIAPKLQKLRTTPPSLDQ